MNPPLPIPILQNLRCGHCRKFVTCGPVHVTPNSSILCGRCVRVAKQMYRNLAFEAIASMYRYPCVYWPKHCNKRLMWNDALKHERNCLFQSGCNVFCSRPGTFFKADRKLPNTTEVNLENPTDEILQNLKCISCENYLSNGPVYLLSDGKNICHRCSHSNGIPKDAIRNLAYETIAISLIFPCIYRFRGCTIRLGFGRDLWGHENECPYGQVQQRIQKKVSKIYTSKDGKERGVIETHSGHIWGTITPHSALFAPPKTQKNDGKMVTQELEEIIKKKHQEEIRGFDAQSMDSVVSTRTFDSLTDNISRHMGDNISRDNISRSTIDNISRDNISTATIENLSRDNVSRSTIDNISRSSSRMVSQDDFKRSSNETMLEDGYRGSFSGAGPSHHPPHSPYSQEVAPNPTPMGYNKIPFNGYYQENVARYGRASQLDPYALYHFPPIYQDNHSPVVHNNSFNYPSPGHPSQIPPKKTESFRIGNQDIIDEIRERHKKQKDENSHHQNSNLQNLSEQHDEVFN